MKKITVALSLVATCAALGLAILLAVYEFETEAGMSAWWVLLPYAVILVFVLLFVATSSYQKRKTAGRNNF